MILTLCTYSELLYVTLTDSCLRTNCCFRFGVSLLVKTLETLMQGRLQGPDNCRYKGFPTSPLLVNSYC